MTKVQKSLNWAALLLGVAAILLVLSTMEQLLADTNQELTLVRGALSEFLRRDDAKRESAAFDSSIETLRDELLGGDSSDVEDEEL